MHKKKVLLIPACSIHSGPAIILISLPSNKHRNRRKSLQFRITKCKNANLLQVSQKKSPEIPEKNAEHSQHFLGACAMTTKFLTIKFALSNLIVVTFPTKNSVLGTIFLSAPTAQPPQKTHVFTFCCRLAVSDFWGRNKNSRVRKRVVSKRVVLADVPWHQKRGNEGTFRCSPVPNTGTRAHSDVRRCQKPERGYIRQNHPFTKPPFCFLSKKTQLRAPQKFKGDWQKEFDHPFSCSGHSFGHFLVTFSDACVTFLPNKSFAGLLLREGEQRFPHFQNRGFFGTLSEAVPFDSCNQGGACIRAKERSRSYLTFFRASSGIFLGHSSQTLALLLPGDIPKLRQLQVFMFAKS